MKRTADAGHAIVWRAAGALCVLTMVIIGILAAQHYLAPSDFSAVNRIAGQKEVTLKAVDDPSASVSVGAGGVSSRCDSCDARHRRIVRLRELNP